jgi:tetratricopeptide (TPR) repeat protein
MEKRACLAVGLIFLAANVAIGETATDFVTSGLSNYKKGDIDGAIRDYDKAIELDPNNATAYYYRGMADIHLSDRIKDYDKAIALKPDFVVAYLNRSLERNFKGDFEGSIGDCNKAIELKPDFAPAYDYRGNLKRVNGDLDGAITDYEKSIQLKPDDASAYVGCGLVNEAKGNLDDAIRDYNKAIELKPTYVAAYYNSGNVKKAKGDFDGAIKDYDKAVELNPKDYSAFNGRAHLHYDKGQWTDALSDFRKSIESNPGEDDYPHFRVWLDRKRLGENKGVDRELQIFMETRLGRPDDWAASIGAFLMGQITEEAFLKAADSAVETKRKEQQCEAYFYAGSKRLIDGDKTLAQSYFELCAATGRKTSYDYASAAAELLRLKGGDVK